MANPDVLLTLDDGVAEVLAILTGMDLSYDPRLDRYNSITRCLNRALRANAFEHEWSYYHSFEEVGTVIEGSQELYLRSTVRPRIIGDDAVQLTKDDQAVAWAFFLPRDALPKYSHRDGLWASVTRSTIRFSRPFRAHEAGLIIKVPVMREPKMFRLPEQPENPNEPLVDVPQAIRDQPLDFDYPDVITLRAAFYYAQTDPVMQPRVQTIEAQYKDLAYNLIERDDRNTDAPYQNEWLLPISGSLFGEPDPAGHGHPHSDERRH